MRNKIKIHTLQTRHKNRDYAAIAEFQSVLKEKMKIEFLFRKLNPTIQANLDAMKEKEIQLAKAEAALRNEKQRNEKLQQELVRTQKKRTKIGDMLKENDVPDPDFTDENTCRWEIQCEQCKAYESTLSVLRPRLRMFNSNF